MTNEKFKYYWDTIVKPHALKCCEGISRVIEINKEIDNCKSENDTSKLKELINEIANDPVKDWVTRYYISQMIFDVEHALADGREGALFITTAYKVLTSKDYYENVFNNIETDEVKSYKKLGQMLKRLLEY